MPRRRMDRDTRVRVMQHEAYRTFARRHYVAIIFGPYIARGLGLAAVVAGLMAAWIYMPHDLLGRVALFLGALILVSWLIWKGSHSGLQARMTARARGTSRPGMGLGWAVAAVVILLGGVGWLSLWSPYA